MITHTRCDATEHTAPLRPIVVKWRDQFFYFPYPVAVRASGQHLVVVYHHRMGEPETVTTGELFCWPCDVRSVA